MINLFGSDRGPGASDIGARCLKKFRPSQIERLNTLVQTHPTLITGAFYFRSTSLNGVDFTFSQPSEDTEGAVVAWSRISETHEFLCAVNTNETLPAVIYVTVDDALHPVDSAMQCFYASDLSPAELNVEVRNGKSIRLTIPPCGLVIYG